MSFNDNEVGIDSRPSDAIALTLRVKAPILVAMKVLDEGPSIDLAVPESKDDDKKKWKGWLKGLPPEDFSKSEM